jgi:nucleoside-diphosphate-sugar epimerase
MSNNDKEESLYTTKDYFLNLPEEDLLHILHNINSWDLIRGKRIFISGATGFVGKWLLSSLLYANSKLMLGIEIYILSRNSKNFLTSFPSLLDCKNIIFLDGNIRDFVLDNNIKFDFAIHAATDVVQERPSIDIFDDCILGTRNFIKNIQQAGCERMLLLSSGAVYGKTPNSMNLIPEDFLGAPDPLDVLSAYGEGKRASELISSILAKDAGLSISFARCFAFIGPFLPLDKHFAIGNFILDAMKDQPIIIKGDGTPMRSYLYSADLTIWLWEILFNGDHLRAYNVGGDYQLSIKDLAEKVVSVLESSSQITIKTPVDSFRPVQKYLPDLNRANNELGLRSHFNLDSAILKTANFNKELY